MKATRSSEMLALTYKTKWRHNPEEYNLHVHGSEKLKYQKATNLQAESGGGLETLWNYHATSN
jgi:hypothetical protein